jgi:prepilin-type N-terminal cleavage/methylation domain-containing protein
VTRIAVQDARGFTLIEVMIAMGLVALMVTASVVGLRSFAKSDLRGTASRMSGAIRYLFDRASTTGKVHRLVLDFETGKYWAESSQDSFVFAAGKETEQSRKREADKVAKEEEVKRTMAEREAFYGASQIPSKYMPKPFIPTRAKFDAFREMVIRPVTIKSGVVLADIYTPRLQKPLDSGRGYIYFFPLGMTEAAVIHLSDKKGESFYTLIVHPLTGRVTVKNSRIEANLTDQFDDSGQAVVQ